jgi:tetratricopeptide (TPR) repeat protein
LPNLEILHINSIACEQKRYSLFCSFARAGQDIFRARFNQSKLMELYRDFLTAAKPELIVTHRRGRGRGAAGPRGRSGQAVLSKAANAEDDDQEQEQDYQDNDDADEVSASPNATGGKTSRRASLSTGTAAAAASDSSNESESELVEDDDLVFVLNELGQAFAAQGQYHTAEAYYHHALRISEKHSASSGAADDATAFGAAGQSADDIGSATGDAVETTSAAATAGESAPIPIPRANSDFASTPSSSAALTSPPLGRAAGSWLAPALASPISLATEHETKRWRRNLATTLHNLGKLYGEQCRFVCVWRACVRVRWCLLLCAFTDMSPVQLHSGGRAPAARTGPAAADVRPRCQRGAKTARTGDRGQEAHAPGHGRPGDGRREHARPGRLLHPARYAIFFLLFI